MLYFFLTRLNEGDDFHTATSSPTPYFDSSMRAWEVTNISLHLDTIIRDSSYIYIINSNCFLGIILNMEFCSIIYL